MPIESGFEFVEVTDLDANHSVISKGNRYLTLQRLRGEGSIDEQDQEESPTEQQHQQQQHQQEMQEPAVASASASAVVPLHERNHAEFGIILVGAVALAFNAGFINGCTIQFRKITVSHVTGTSSHIGLDLANNDWDSLAIATCLIVCFIGGSSITGVFVPERSFHLGIQYGPLFLIGSGLLLVACFVAHYFPASYWYFYLAAMASGLQNALTTRYSGSIIRTTHVTGTATDIGLVLGKLLVGNTKELWKLKILCPLLFSFIFGGFASVFAYRKMGKLALSLNVVVFFGVGLSYSILIGSQFHIPIWKAFLGTYENVEKTVKESSEKAKHVVKKSAVVMKRAANDATKFVAASSTKMSSGFTINPMQQQEKS